MKPTIKVFESFEDADAYAEEEQLRLTPEERIELCFQLSIAGWELHHGSLPQESIRANPNIIVKSLHEDGVDELQ